MGKGCQAVPTLSQAVGNAVLLPTLQTARGTRSERLENLLYLDNMECGRRDDYEKKLAPLARMLYEEGKAIGAATEADKKVMLSLHYQMDNLELGRAEANKKLLNGGYANE